MLKTQGWAKSDEKKTTNEKIIGGEKKPQTEEKRSRFPKEGASAEEGRLRGQKEGGSSDLKSVNHKPRPQPKW